MFHGLSGGNTSQLATVTPGPTWPPGTPPAPPSLTVLPELLPLPPPLLPPEEPPDDPPEEPPEEPPEDPPDDPPELPPLPPLELPVALSPAPPSAAFDELLLLHPLENARATVVPRVSGQTSQRPLPAGGVGSSVDMDGCSRSTRSRSNLACRALHTL